MSAVNAQTKFDEVRLMQVLVAPIVSEKATMIAEKSCCDVEVTFSTLMPVMLLICFSMGCVTRFSISRGVLPAYTVCT